MLSNHLINLKLCFVFYSHMLGWIEAWHLKDCLQSIVVDRSQNLRKHIFIFTDTIRIRFNNFWDLVEDWFGALWVLNLLNKLHQHLFQITINSGFRWHKHYIKQIKFLNNLKVWVVLQLNMVLLSLSLDLNVLFSTFITYLLVITFFNSGYLREYLRSISIITNLLTHLVSVLLRYGRNHQPWISWPHIFTFYWNWILNLWGNLSDFGVVFLLELFVFDCCINNWKKLCPSQIGFWEIKLLFILTEILNLLNRLHYGSSL